MLSTGKEIPTTYDNLLSDKEYKSNNSENVVSLKQIRRKNINRIIFAYLNINSLRNKFDFLVDQCKGNVDVLMISETKLDSSFPVGQFLIEGFSMPFRLDRNKNGGGIMLFVREDIPVKLLSTEVHPIESFYIEINISKKKMGFVLQL
jgi:hypothetical protein